MLYIKLWTTNKYFHITVSYLKAISIYVLLKISWHMTRMVLLCLDTPDINTVYLRLNLIYNALTFQRLTTLKHYYTFDM